MHPFLIHLLHLGMKNMHGKEVRYYSSVNGYVFKNNTNNVKYSQFIKSQIFLCLAFASNYFKFYY